MIPSKPQRIRRHLLADHRTTRRAFSPQALQRIEAVIAAGEKMHDGQVRFVVEAALPMTQVFRGQTPRDRALELFGRLGIWDTELNCGVLVYLLLADKDVEIVADRGINRKVDPEVWQTICRAMEAAFRDAHFEEGIIEGIEAIGGLLAQHFPRTNAGSNELPDQPIVL